MSYLDCKGEITRPTVFVTYFIKAIYLFLSCKEQADGNKSCNAMLCHSWLRLVSNMREGEEQQAKLEKHRCAL